MDATEFVAIRVEKVAKVSRSVVIFSESWRILDTSSAIRNRNVMKFLYLFWRVANETNRGAVRRYYGFTVLRFCDTEGGAFVRIEESFFSIVIGPLVR